MGKQSAIVNVLIGVAPMLLALIVVCFASLNHFFRGAGALLGVLVMLSGFVAFSLAKLTRFRSGVWFSRGTRGMPVWARRTYAIGYIAIVVGAIGSLSAVVWL